MKMPGSLTEIETERSPRERTTTIIARCGRCGADRIGTVNDSVLEDMASARALDTGVDISYRLARRLDDHVCMPRHLRSIVRRINLDAPIHEQFETISVVFAELARDAERALRERLT